MKNIESGSNGNEIKKQAQEFEAPHTSSKDIENKGEIKNTEDLEIRSTGEYEEAVKKAKEYGFIMEYNPLDKYPEEFKFAKEGNDWLLAEKVNDRFKEAMIQ